MEIEETDSSSYLFLKDRFLWCNATAQYLSKNMNKDIKGIDLTTNHVDNVCMDILIGYMLDPDSKLEGMILDQCRITASSIIKLFSSLPKSHLRYLSLNRNVVTVEVCESIYKAFSADPELDYLSLCECDIPANGCVIIAKGLPLAKHLETLKLESNCIFDRGCEAIAANIAQSNIKQLSLADNHIWSTGTNAILKAINGNPKITALNLSYNIIDLYNLTQAIKPTPNLKSLSISGCKVSNSQILLFLEELGRTQLTTFMIEGLNQNQLPISWPHAQDILWTNRTNFEVLIRALRTSQTLVDLRFGFLDTKQIQSFMNLYQSNQMTRPITICISDFGRTGNNWVANFPNFNMEAPVSTLKWGTQIISEEAQFFGTLFKSSTFEGKPLDSLDISGTKMTDDILQKLLDGFHDVHLKTLNLNQNDFSDNSVETITPFFEHSSVERLILTKTNLTEYGFQRFFRYFARDQPTKIPKVLKFSFTTNDPSETGSHQFFNDLATLVSKDSPLEELVIHGNVTAADLMPVFTELIKNSHLRKIAILSDIPDKYSNGEQTIDPTIQTMFNDLVAALRHSVLDPSSTSILSQITYPLLTNVLLFSDEILSVWGELEAKLDQNKKITENMGFHYSSEDEEKLEMGFA